MKKRQEKSDRDNLRDAQVLQMKQMESENKKWSAVDKTDGRHLKKEAAKRQDQAAKDAKKREKKDLYEEDEAKEERSAKKPKKGAKNWAGE